MRIVLDTNVLCHACAPSTGPAFELLNRIAAQREHVLVVSRHIIAEVRDVLAREYFHMQA